MKSSRAASLTESLQQRRLGTIEGMENAGWDEPEALARAQAGDKEAFGWLFDRFFDDIFRFVNAQLPETADAEDVALEVFVKAWDFLPRYTSRGHSFSAFLYSVARNAVVDFYRRGKDRDAAPLEDTLLADNEPLPEERLIAERERQDLYRALAGLPDDYREVLILRFINNHSLEEVTQAMNRSSGAVRVLQHRALKALRKQLEKQGKP